MKKERIPSCWQARDLEMLMMGRQLVITSADGIEHIYWRWDTPDSILGEERIDCGSPKRKRQYMSHMERYGWVLKTPTGWEITEDGREAKRRYDAV